MRKRTHIGYYKGLRRERVDKRGGRAYVYGIMRLGDDFHIVYTAAPRIAGSWWVPVKYAEMKRRMWRELCALVKGRGGGAPQ